HEGGSDRKPRRAAHRTAPPITTRDVCSATNSRPSRCPLQCERNRSCEPTWGEIYWPGRDPPGDARLLVLVAFEEPKRANITSDEYSWFTLQSGSLYTLLHRRLSAAALRA